MSQYITLLLVGSVVMPSLSFTMLLTCVFSLFLISVARDLSILMIFSRKPAFGLTDFLHWVSGFFFIISLISAHMPVISSPLCLFGVRIVSFVAHEWTQMLALDFQTPVSPHSFAREGLPPPPPHHHWQLAVCCPRWAAGLMRVLLPWMCPLLCLTDTAPPDGGTQT